MSYFKCKECWRVYDRWQLTEGPMESCVCGSRRFKNAPNLLLRRLFTDFRYVLNTWIKERLTHEKRS
jgi:DNA-directed RNA polymerase subunit RPC12/RpoP